MKKGKSQKEESELKGEEKEKKTATSGWQKDKEYSEKKKYAEIWTNPNTAKRKNKCKRIKKE